MSINNYTFAEIDLSAVGHNLSEIRKVIPRSTKIMAIVKADAYGHGAVPVSQTAVASGADMLGVASLKEALELRLGGIKAPILILSESLPENAQSVIEAGLTQTVYTLRLAEALSSASSSLGKKAKIHFKVDTGMGRVGASVDEAEMLIDKVRSLPGIEIEGILTHFAKADEPTDSYTPRQLSLFKELIRKIEAKKILIPIKHAANSAATLYHPDTHLDMVRVGLAMYGLYPGGIRDGVSLKSALSFKTKVMYIKRVPAGTYLSYGATYRTPKESTIITLPVGYADGYNRILSNKSEVLLNGKRFPVVGRISMDMTLVNAGDESVSIGEEAVLIGLQGAQSITADDIAAMENTISYEVVCGIGKRVPRIYKK